MATIIVREALQKLYLCIKSKHPAPKWKILAKRLFIYITNKMYLHKFISTGTSSRQLCRTFRQSEERWRVGGGLSLINVTLRQATPKPHPSSSGLPWFYVDVTRAHEGLKDPSASVWRNKEKTTLGLFAEHGYSPRAVYPPTKFTSTRNGL